MSFSIIRLRSLVFAKAKLIELADVLLIVGRKYAEEVLKSKSKLGII